MKYDPKSESTRAALEKAKIRLLLAISSTVLMASLGGCGPESGTVESTEESPIGQVAQALTADVRHVLIYHKPGYFAAWPANHGIYIWGNEILVGFERAVFVTPPPNGGMHHTTGSGLVYMARSLDGGEHWSIQDPGNPSVPDDYGELDITLDDDDEPAEDDKPPLDRARPHFAMKLLHNGYWISQSRGHASIRTNSTRRPGWKGPYAVPDFEHENLSGRTAIVHTDEKTFIFMSATNGAFSQYATGVTKADEVARSMVFWTEDAGETFGVSGVIAPRPGPNCTPLPPPCPVGSNYSLMASPVFVDDGTPNGKLYAALRERAGDESRIKIVRSEDGGVSWGQRSIPVQGNGGPNNPGSLVQLQNGHLALVWGDRRYLKIRAMISVDGGASWGPYFDLTEAAVNNDMGYVQAVVRPDGKVVVVYYFNTVERPEQHIRATIWTPEGVDPNPPASSLSESLIMSAL